MADRIKKYGNPQDDDDRNVEVDIHPNAVKTVHQHNKDSAEVSQLKQFLETKLQEQNDTLLTNRSNHKNEMTMLKKDLHETKKRYVDLEKRLESQERLIKEIYEVKLSDVEGNLKDNVDVRYNDLQTFITKTLRDMTMAPITQQSQPAGPANDSVMVEKPSYDGGGL